MSKHYRSFLFFVVISITYGRHKSDGDHACFKSCESSWDQGCGAGLYYFFPSDISLLAGPTFFNDKDLIWKLEARYTVRYQSPKVESGEIVWQADKVTKYPFSLPRN